MIDEKELREGVEAVEPSDNDRFACSDYVQEYIHKLERLRPLAEAYLKVGEGLPEKIVEKCGGIKYWTDCGYEYDCEYDTEILCDDCKYGGKSESGDGKDPHPDITAHNKAIDDCRLAYTKKLMSGGLEKVILDNTYEIDVEGDATVDRDSIETASKTIATAIRTYLTNHSEEVK